jgi:hypothetical protein
VFITTTFRGVCPSVTVARLRRPNRQSLPSGNSGDHARATGSQSLVGNFYQVVPGRLGWSARRKPAREVPDEAGRRMKPAVMR